LGPTVAVCPWHTGQSGAHRTVRCHSQRAPSCDLSAQTVRLSHRTVRCTPDRFCSLSGAPPGAGWQPTSRISSLIPLGFFCSWVLDFFASSYVFFWGVASSLPKSNPHRILWTTIINTSKYISPQIVSIIKHQNLLSQMARGPFSLHYLLFCKDFRYVISTLIILWHLFLYTLLLYVLSSLAHIWDAPGFVP
jgi:hypothetical protein